MQKKISDIYCTVIIFDPIDIALAYSADEIGVGNLVPSLRRNALISVSVPSDSALTEIIYMMSCNQCTGTGIVFLIFEY